MSRYVIRYVVRVTGPAGVVRYLWRGLTMEAIENAQRFVYRGSALNAANQYLLTHENITTDVIDMTDQAKV